MTAKKLLRETLLLSVGAFWMRGLGLFCSMWLTKRLGTRTLGLSQLVWTVYGFAGTLCCAGVRLAVTQLCARAAAGGYSGRKILRFCLMWALAAGSFCAAALNAFAPAIAASLLHEARLAPALARAAVGLPFLAMSSALYGFYTARSRLIYLTGLQCAEQLVSIGLTVLLVRQTADSFTAAAALAAASTATEIFAFAAAVCFLPRDGAGEPAPVRPRTFLRIVLPSAISGTAAAGLRAIQEISIPAMLAAWGLTESEALSAYGAVGGIVYPILFFPAAVLTSLSIALVPELTGAYAKHDYPRMRRLCETTLRETVAFSAVCCFFVRAFAAELTASFFGDASRGALLALFSPMILLAYLDLITDSMLRSIDRPLHATAGGVIDAAFCLLLARLLVPRYGLGGLVAAVLAAKLLNLSMSLIWLASSLSLRFSARRDLLPLLLAYVSAAAAKAVFPAGQRASLFCHAVLTLLIFICLTAAQHPFKRLRKNGKHGTKPMLPAER